MRRNGDAVIRRKISADSIRVGSVSADVILLDYLSAIGKQQGNDSAVVSRFCTGQSLILTAVEDVIANARDNLLKAIELWPRGCFPLSVGRDI